MGSVPSRKGARRCGKRGGTPSWGAFGAVGGAGAAGAPGAAVALGPVERGAAAPGPVVREVPSPEDVEPEDAGPKDAESESSELEDAEPEDVEPEDVEPEGPLPEGAESEDTQPENTEPEDAEPEDTGPEGSVPEGPEPEGTGREDAEPEDAGPEGTRPEDTEPEAVPGAQMSFSAPGRGPDGGDGTRGVPAVPGTRPDVVLVASSIAPGRSPSLPAPSQSPELPVPFRSGVGASVGVRGPGVPKPDVRRAPSGAASASPAVSSVVSSVFGGVDGCGGMEARRASVLMPPPVSSYRRQGRRSPCGAGRGRPGHAYPRGRAAIRARTSARGGSSLREASLYGLTPAEREPVRGTVASARIVPLPCGIRVWQASFMTARAADRARYDRATAHLDAPLAIVDLEAFDANADDVVRRAAGKPIRVASKSVRCRALLERVLAREGFAGIMSFTLGESLWLARSGFDDILLAYPSADRKAFAELASDPKLAAAVTVVVDDPAQLRFIDEARGGGREVVRVCLELDTSLQLLRGRVRIGARRSPLRTPDQLADLARAVARRPGFRLVGIMAYEGHIAGVGDAVPGQPVRSRAIRLMQATARRQLVERRAAVVRAVRAVAPDLEFVNGGGTGSVQTTAAEDAVTEIAAGSGLYVPRLFDNYTSFRGRPAALFALPVVRRPGVGVVTVLGGGYPASGAAGADRLPVPYLPEGLRYDAQEGPGEVQTPLLGAPADDLLVGDKVWFRHAKAGELCERFEVLRLVAGDTVTATVPTYRGEGHTFL